MIKYTIKKIVESPFLLAGRFMSNRAFRYINGKLTGYARLFESEKLRCSLPNKPKVKITFGQKVLIKNPQLLHIGDYSEIGNLTRIEVIDNWRNQVFNPNIQIGHHVIISPFTHIGCINEIQIGNYVSIGQRTYITDHVHGKSDFYTMTLPSRQRELFSKGGVYIGDYVSIGENVAILPGVTIGNNSIIGANSVVTKDIPAYAIACGNPAKVIKIITKEDQ